MSRSYFARSLSRSQFSKSSTLQRLTLGVGIALAVSACAAPGPSSSESTSSPAPVISPSSVVPSAAVSRKIRVALVADVGGLADGSMNAAANRGRQQAEAELGVETIVFESKAPEDHLTFLTKAADEKYDLVIAVGALMAVPVSQIARKYTNVRFALLDATPFNTDRRSFESLPNVANILFRNNEAAYLVGVIAGELVKAKVPPVTHDVVCSLGAVKGPEFVSLLDGFEDGVKSVSPSIKLLRDYLSDRLPTSNDEVQSATAKAKTIGLTQISQGCDILFDAASASGVGYILAAQEKGRYAMAVYPTGSNVNDQLLLAGNRPGGVVAAVALRRVDLAVKATIGTVVTSSFKSGDNVFGAANDGIAYGPTDVALPESVRAAAATAYSRMKSGQIVAKGALTEMGPP